MQRKLGKTQMDVLRALVEHKSWHPGSGWVWANRSTTERILDSLVRRGLAEKVPSTRSSGGISWRPTASGRAWF